MLDAKLVAIYIKYEQLQCRFYSEASFLSQSSPDTFKK